MHRMHPNPSSEIMLGNLNLAEGGAVEGSAGATATRRRQKQKRPGKKKGGVLRNAKDLRVRRRDRDDRR